VTKIDPYSEATVPVEQYFNGTLLGVATAFIFEKRERFYLITNYHVVAMIDPNTGANLHKKAARPNKLRVGFCLPRRDFGKVPIDIPLRDKDDKPLWLVHPVHKNKIDVVAIPLEHPKKDEFRYEPINRLPKEELSVQIGMDVFVLGYPFGNLSPGLPVWKRGSIASEPALVGIGHRYMLIDSASRPGMSGGPVILRSYGTHLTESGPSITTEPATRFIGLYSGRLHTKDALEAQLGMVWPRSLIEEIIDTPTLDKET